MENYKLKIVNLNGKDVALLEGDKYVSKWAQEMGRLDHDQNMLPYVLPIIKEGDTVMDVGAFIGDHTIAYAKKAGVSGRVIAFEPNHESFECLKFNMKEFENAELRKEALSDEVCRVRINEVEENAGRANVEKSKKGIKCVTIDSLNLDKLDFIKIDAEGFEHKILKGAEETIKRLKPIMLIEIVNDYLLRNKTSNNDIYIYLAELGYNYRNVYPEQSLYEQHLDLLCTPK